MHSTHTHHAFAVLFPTWHTHKESCHPRLFVLSTAESDDDNDDGNNNGDERAPESHLGVFFFFFENGYFFFKDTYGRLNIQTGVLK